MRSSKQIIESINENFYKTIDTSEKLIDFIHELSAAICQENDLPQVKLTIKHLNPYTMGLYYDDKKEIELNSYNIYESFDVLKNTNNLFLIFSVVDAVSHETRHYLQHHDVKDLHPMVKAIAEFTEIDDGERIIVENNYHMSPHEVDARYYAYQTLAQSPTMKKYLDSSSYILREQTRTRKPFDYAPLLKIEKYQFEKVLGKIDNILWQNVGQNLYYQIAPGFDFSKVQPLSAKDSNKIRKELLEFQKNLETITHDYMDELNDKAGRVIAEYNAVLDLIQKGEYVSPAEYNKRAHEFSEIRNEIEQAQRTMAIINAVQHPHIPVQTEDDETFND